jgi:hypothetical protein
MPYIDRVSFVAGLVVGVILAWALVQVMGWLRGVFHPPSDQSLGQKVATGVRKLVASLLVLLTLVAMGYIVYTVVFK